MPITSGSQLGPYQIVGRLGEGGMGEVYRAQDTRLQREVALKVLPAEVAQDPGRRARFEQEARATAALNHPNIVGIYDIGTAEVDHQNIVYMVSELVDGSTLESQMLGAQLPIKRLLDLAVQIADGMAGAHAANITHRDLKPANIMVTKDGRAKILDFGLAKQAPSATPTDSDRTATMALTQAGAILGTVNYMSPEQAAGKPVDIRSDQFSFGLILYELLTGKKAFARDSAVQTMAAILTDEVPAIDRQIPEPLRWVLDRCLAKQPIDRYESTRDLYLNLKNIRDHIDSSNLSSSSVPGIQAPATAGPLSPAVAVPTAAIPTAAIPTQAPSAKSLWPRILSFATGAVVTAITALVIGGGEPPKQDLTLTPFAFEQGGVGSPVFSPDGKAVAYTGTDRPGGVNQVYVRYLDSSTSVRLTDLAEGAIPSFWTPDGAHIIFRTSKQPAGYWSIAAVGGEPQPLTAGTGAPAVALSPDMNTMAGLKQNENGTISVWVKSPLSAELKRYEPSPFEAKQILNVPMMRFSPDGKQILLYVNVGRGTEEGWLLPYPPDPSHPPHRIFENAITSGSPTFSWMPDSRHVVMARAPKPTDSFQLWMGDTQTGDLRLMSSSTMSQGQPSASPDGQRLAFVESSTNLDVVSLNLQTGAVEPEVATPRSESMPAWSKQALTYVTDRNGPSEIWLRQADSSFAPAASAAGPGAVRWMDRPAVTAKDFKEPVSRLMAPVPSPDSRRIIYAMLPLNGEIRLWISSTSGGAPVRLTNSNDEGMEFSGSWSPDGAWFVYWKLENANKGSLYKVQTTGQATPTLLLEGIGTRNGMIPVWSPDGKWIYHAGQKSLLISPDGTQQRDLGELNELGSTFSADGSQLLGLRSVNGKMSLFRVGLDGRNLRDIATVPEQWTPRNIVSPAMRLSLAPDGEHLTYSIVNTSSGIWMMDGIGLPPPSLLERLGLR